MNAPKISLYGDSTTAGHGYPARMMARAGGKIAGVNDYSRGGNSFADNLAGKDDLFGGLTFAEHVALMDDAEICVIRLGANCVPDGWVVDDIQACLGADYLQIAADCLQHVQYAKAAGKRPVLVGTPYTDLAASLAWWPDLTPERAVLEFQRIRCANTAIRCVSGAHRVPFIATHGYGGAGGYPTPTAADVPDGVHPTQAYADAVADYLADQIIAIFGL